MLELLIKARCLLLQCGVIGGIKESRHYCEWIHNQTWQLDWYFEQLAYAIPQDIDLDGKLLLTTDLGALESALLDALTKCVKELDSAARTAFATDLLAFKRLLDCLLNLSDFTNTLATKLKVRDFCPAPCEE